MPLSISVGEMHLCLCMNEETASVLLDITDTAAFALRLGNSAVDECSDSETHVDAAGIPRTLVWTHLGPVLG